MKKSLIKRKLCFLLALCLLFSFALGETGVLAKAAKGPESSADSQSYLKVFSYAPTMTALENEAFLYAGGFFAQYDISVSKVKGATYNKSTNTLKLKNYNKPDIYVEANMMGDDFKVEVEGENSIAGLKVWGYGYCGSVTITGTGTLTINENKTNVTGCGIYVNAENSASFLSISNTVAVTTYRNNGYRSDTGSYTGALGYPIFVGATTLTENALVSQGKLSGKVKSEVYPNVESLRNYYIDEDVVTSAKTSAPQNSKKKVKISKKSLTLTVGDKATISLLNNKKKVTWSIKSGESCISIKNKKNKVTITAKKAGSAKVVGKVGNKEYTCAVTVTKKSELACLEDLVKEQIKRGSGMAAPGTEDYDLMYSADDKGNIEALYLNDLVGKVSLADFSHLEILQISNYAGGEYKTDSRLTEIDLSENTALKSIWITNNKLATLNLNKCTKLEEITLDDSVFDTVLLNASTTLKSFSMRGSKLGNGLNVKGYKALEMIYITKSNVNEQNSDISKINATGCKALEQINAVDCRMTSLEVKNCSALHNIECYGNKISTLDVSGLKSLYSINCCNNNMGKLIICKGTDTCPKLEELAAHTNDLVSINVKGTKLKYKNILVDPECEILGLSD